MKWVAGALIGISVFLLGSWLLAELWWSNFAW